MGLNQHESSGTHFLQSNAGPVSTLDPFARCDWRTAGACS